MNSLERLAVSFAYIGVDCFYVGGCVRDELLGKDSDDIDICLVGVKDKADVAPILSRFATSVAKEVGNSFPVWIADIPTVGKVDFALARTESSTGEGHRDFTVLTKGVTIEDDLRRRDLTVNAIAKNVRTGEIVDPFGGAQDLENGIAREVSPAFSEDPLRVLRAARFCARFDLSPTGSLLMICENQNLTRIPAERIAQELKKTFEQTDRPSRFFRFLESTNHLSYIFPELYDLIGVQQSETHHPEGDAFQHTMHCIDAAKGVFTRIVMLCHDLGKATCTVVKDGKVSAVGHDTASVELGRAMLNRLNFASVAGFGKKRIEQALVLVDMHMLHTVGKIKDGKLAQKANRLHEAGLDFDDLVSVMEADESGRPPLAPDFTFIHSLRDRVREMVSAGRFTPVVTSQMLLERGVEKGPRLGELLREAFRLQLSGGLTAANWDKVLHL